MLVPMGFGELIDRLTILDLKLDRIADPRRRANVSRERLALVAAAGAPLAERLSELSLLVERLRKVNEGLWDVEDQLRRHERLGDFGPDFVTLARSVYRLHDERAAIKREIGERAGSTLLEEKSYNSEKP